LSVPTLFSKKHDVGDDTFSSIEINKTLSIKTYFVFVSYSICIKHQIVIIHNNPGPQAEHCAMCTEVIAALIYLNIQ